MVRRAGESIRLLTAAAVLVAALGGVAACSRGAAEDESRPTVVATTSMMESAVRALLPEGEAAPRVRRLLAPGSCPGHFDLPPSALPELRGAALILRHDYQKTLDEKIRSLGAGDVRTLAVATAGSLLVPETYAEFLGAAAEALAERLPETAPGMEARLAAARGALEPLAAQARERAPAWRGRRVVVSANQKQFAEWLGLEVVGVFARPEAMSPTAMAELVDGGADLVVGNLQEGLDAARAIAERAGVPLVVFSNFPGTQGGGETYADLFHANLDRLEAACATTSR